MSTRIDPVCGMEVTQKKPPTSTFGEQQYFFCSRECKDAFEKDPEHYLEPEDVGAQLE